MAVLMFSSSIGLSMDIHFCGNELKSFSFFGEAKACQMEQVKQETESSHACCAATKKEIKSCHSKEMTNGNCCHNESLVLDNAGEFDTSDFYAVQFQQILITVLVFSPNFQIFENANAALNYAHYNPPPLIEDISILHQVFRI